MDRFFDRLGDVLKTYLNSEEQNLSDSLKKPAARSGDPDLDAAYEELNDFLGNTKVNEKRERKFEERLNHPQWSEEPKIPSIPESLRTDFEELGVVFGASAEDCKAAHKKLLKIHHPDRHAGHPGNMAKATEKSSRINASYQKIEEWREKGR